MKLGYDTENSLFSFFCSYNQFNDAMPLFAISLFINILFWIYIIRKYDRFEREPFMTVLGVMLAGGFMSSLPAGLLNHFVGSVLGYNHEHWMNDGLNLQKIMLFYGFVGLNEEFLKAAVTIILVRNLKQFNEPADALVYSMSVALGFSAFENVQYMLDYGYLTFVVRQFNAVPLHIGLAAIWGVGIAKAKYLYTGRYFSIVVFYVLFAAFIHGLYNVMASWAQFPFLGLLLNSGIGLAMIVLATRLVKKYAESGPFRQ